MFTLWIGDPDAEDDPETQDDVTLGGEADVFRAFKPLTDMCVERYGVGGGHPYPDLLMVPTYHMQDMVLDPDHFRRFKNRHERFWRRNGPRTISCSTCWIFSRMRICRSGRPFMIKAAGSLCEVRSRA